LQFSAALGKRFQVSEVVTREDLRRRTLRRRMRWVKWILHAGVRGKWRSRCQLVRGKREVHRSEDSQSILRELPLRHILAALSCCRMKKWCLRLPPQGEHRRRL